MKDIKVIISDLSKEYSLVVTPSLREIIYIVFLVSFVVILISFAITGVDLFIGSIINAVLF